MAIDLQRERAALDWFEERRDEFLAALTQAREREDDSQVLELATSFAPFLARRSYWDEGRPSSSGPCRPPVDASSRDRPPRCSTS